MSGEAKTKIVWKGHDGLRKLLVPVEDVHPLPGNARLGDVEAIKQSLARFGQYRPIVANADGTILAGNHTYRAVVELGFNRIAVVRVEMDETEARAAALADNRTADLGQYDTALLVEHLKYLAELDALEGTGFSTDDLDDELARLRSQLDAEPLVPVSFLAKPPSELVEMVLLYSAAQREQVETWLKIVQKERGCEGLSESVFEALKLAALTLNAGS